MPNEPQSVRSFLIDREAALVSELRRDKPDAFNEYLKVRAAIEAMDSTAETIGDAYYDIRKPLDAVEAYLKKIGRPTAMKAIAKDCMAGGFGRGQVQRPDQNIMYALRRNIEKEEKSAKRFKELNGLVGKVEWPEEMFSAIQKEKE